METNMKILVDGDACPVKIIIEQVAKKFQISVIIIIDTSHELYSDYSEIIQVSKAPDAVDLAVINRCKPGDIIVTSDFGVATLGLGKKAYVINQNGRIYDNDNIDLLMLERHISARQRRQGKRSHPIKKRTKEDDEQFKKAFLQLCSIVSDLSDTSADALSLQ
jgi:uncharacterized protein